MAFVAAVVGVPEDRARAVAQERPDDFALAVEARFRRDGQRGARSAPGRAGEHGPQGPFLRQRTACLRRLHQREGWRQSVGRESFRQENRLAGADFAGEIGPARGQRQEEQTDNGQKIAGEHEPQRGRRCAESKAARLL